MWLRVILRLDRYRVEERMKFGSKNLVGVTKLAWVPRDPMIGGLGHTSFQFSMSFISMKTRLINQSIAFMLFITKLNQKYVNSL